MRPIPKTAEMIPAIGLGTFETFDIRPGETRDNVREVIRLFHARGGRVIDTSPLYGVAEVCVGDFVTDLGISEDIFITNKTWTTGDYLSDNSHSERQLRQSRERLWRDQIDVLQVHSLENHDQVRHWLAQKKAEGSVRYIGITQWSPEYYDTMERLVNTGTLDFVDNMGALYGELPDPAMRKRMADHYTGLAGVADALKQPPYPGKNYGGVVTWPFPQAPQRT
ncbi:aldo/keto reductase [Rhizobium sp. SEMIA 4085]|uniref:aldo/keto reductase n=1 Tax=Rhizobium sp. SEMIA 4085 TaxID=2137761 RepID=UPI001FED9A4F|nr:aldo/keto reductase [Rhizobium sp. SEMIA 4085]